MDNIRNGLFSSKRSQKTSWQFVAICVCNLTHTTIQTYHKPIAVDPREDFPSALEGANKPVELLEARHTYLV